MTDRELLEAAAKAAGYQVVGDADKMVAQPGIHAGGLVIRNERGGDSLWHPGADDGDALRLAVKLRLSVDAWGSGAAAIVSLANRAMVAEPHYGDDPERATRRAIVRAAAAMEKL